MVEMYQPSHFYTYSEQWQLLKRTQQLITTANVSMAILKGSLYDSINSELYTELYHCIRSL